MYMDTYEYNWRRILEKLNPSKDGLTSKHASFWTAWGVINVLGVCPFLDHCEYLKIRIFRGL